MSGPSSSRASHFRIHHVHIADGFTDDCEELIHRWLKTNTLTYEKFCEIWKDMQFSFLYHGRSSGAEVAELSEELLQIAKHYMVSNTDNFEESVAGLFLVYALLRLQPYARFAALRVVPEDTPALTRLETVARRERRYDVLYILGSVLIEGPVQYQAFNRERGMETSIRKYLEGTTGIDRLGVRPKGVFYRQNEESDLLRELNSITKRYTEAKRCIGGNSQGLNYMDENLANDLHKSLKEIINGIVEEGPEGNKKMQDHYSKVQEIKDKAMRQAVNGVAHLASVSDNLQHRSQRRCSNALKTAEKKKSPSSNCLLSSSKRKRSPSSSDSDQPLPSDDEYLPSGRTGSNFEMSSQPSQDINVQEFDKEKNAPPKEEDREIEIEIDALPVFIRTEQDGNIYEIEVIDNLDQPKTSTEEKDPNTKLKKSTAASLEKDDSLEGTSQVLKVEVTGISKRGRKKKNPEEVKKKKQEKAEEKRKEAEKKREEAKHRLRRREMRELKKPALMSKFKKMGLLDMGSFQNSPDKDKKKT